MHLLPTTRAIHLTGAGISALLAGAVLGAPALTELGGALLLGLFASRAFSHLSVARARASGFEMVWRSDAKMVSATRLEPFEVWAELQNRDRSPTDFRNLAVLHGPGLEVSVCPRAGTIAAHSSLLLRVSIRPLRVGVQGLFGLSLETIRAPGLFQAPLVFPSALAVQVSPRWTEVGSPHTGPLRLRERQNTWLTRGVRAEAGEFRELREHRPGDPYHRIAWKPSARRGKLLVVDSEVSDIETSWLLLDASQELSLGPVGFAPLDEALDRTARLALRLLARGQRVGLAIVGRRVLHRLSPAKGTAHARRLLGALTQKTHAADGDRSEWSLGEVEDRVREHMRFVAPLEAERVRHDPMAFVELARTMADKAPFPAAEVRGQGRDEAVLRRYLHAYGIVGAASHEVDRPFAEAALAQVMIEVLSSRPRPTSIHVLARYPAQETPPRLWRELGVLPQRGVTVVLHPVSELPHVPTVGSEKAAMAEDALRILGEVGARRAEGRLKALGVRVASDTRLGGASWTNRPPGRLADGA